MTVIDALVVDDEPIARANIRVLLQRHPRWRVAAECASAEEAERFASRRHIDVAFLDIRLRSGDDGLAVARRFNDAPGPLVVFSTAFAEYAVDAFDLQAADYLLKPYTDARFDTAVRRVETMLASPDRRGPDRIVVKTIGHVHIVEVADIESIEAAGNYVDIRTPGGSYLHRERISELERRLDPAQFLRIHRSTIVNRTAVREIRPVAGGDCVVTLASGRVVRLSRIYGDARRLLAESPI